ncbi:MAG: PTS IIA-like nitrogen-regulatory protein PtsN [Rhodospirillaceae bacterium]|nr:PTS IIA-like nitrogen-regulatory protein PtsN [Rhodospirillaceae bacterium]|tara:strand:- start:45459 stop:45923 length:465 start_codon:yes stop_codon:yes gene_type:complete
MEICDLLSPESVVSTVRATSKKQALQELAAQAAKVSGQNERAIFDVLLERERLGTTGIGRGVAIPHGKLPELDRLYGVFAKLEQPVDFEAVDDQAVDMVFLLLAPESAGADHLKALARISRLFRDGEMCKKLRAANDDSSLCKLLLSGTAISAA